MTSSWLPKSIAFLLLTLSFRADALLQDEANNIDVYKKAHPAVVNITAVTLTRDFFFDVIPQKGVGSGAIIRGDGYIVTNSHVVGGAQKVEVTLHDKTQLPAEVVGADLDTDLAVLKVDPKGKNLPSLPYGEHGKLQVGQKVLAIGNPFGLGGSLTVGIISSLGRDIRATNQRTIKDVIQTDAAINPGNSGGPLLNSDGQLIGINTQIVSASGGSDGVGFAISGKTVKEIVDQLIRSGEVLRPTLGVAGIGMPGSFLRQLGIPADAGIMITELWRKGPAAKAGLKEADKELLVGFRRIPVGGDVITAIDNQPVATMQEVLDIVSEKKPGASVTVHYYRGRAKKSASVKLALPPGTKSKGI